MALLRNSKQAKQAIDFDGIQNGKIHPTDIDAVLEFDNDALILMEVKRVGNKIPIGQKLVLERICDSWHNYKCIVLYITHDFKNDDKDIPMEQCSVDEYYYNKKWKKSSNKELKKVLNAFGKVWDIKKLTIK
jgi:hypothetical protein